MEKKPVEFIVTFETGRASTNAEAVSKLFLEHKSLQHQTLNKCKEAIENKSKQISK